MNAFFSKITNFFKTTYAQGSSLFVQVFGQQAADDFAHGAAALLKTALGVIAVDAVQASTSMTRNPDGTASTTDDKKAAAFRKIATDAKAQGLNVSSSVANLLIELAVQKVVKQNVVPIQ